jgi:hypothetical protein
MMPRLPWQRTVSYGYGSTTAQLLRADLHVNQSRIAPLTRKTDMAKKKTEKTKSNTKPKKSKSKVKAKTSNSKTTNSKMKHKSLMKIPAKPISGYLENLNAVADEKEISDSLKHLYAVAKDLGIGCEIHHDKESGGYVVSLDEASEDRSFLTTAEAEEFLHEQEQD